MKKYFLLLLFTVLVFAGRSQDDGIRYMTQANNDSTFSMILLNSGWTLSIVHETDSLGNYTDGPYDRHLTVTGNCDSTTGNQTKLCLYFESFNVDPHDTLFVYDGPTINSPLLAASNNNLNPLSGVKLFPGGFNTSNKLTIRFKTNGDGITGGGFTISVMCSMPCETVIPVIDSFFYKTNRAGEIIDTGFTKNLTQIDTVYNADSSDFTLEYQYYLGVHLCLGEGVILNAHGEYTNNYGIPVDDSWSIFSWNFGNGDTLTGISATQAQTFYRDLDCYDVTLRITDGMGCRSMTQATVRVRLAQNPIKTIYDLNPICSTDSNIVRVGYGEGAAITLRKISFEKMKSKTIDCKTFIPDGNTYSCAAADEDGGFRAPIFFDDFPAGRSVTSKGDICSVCVNFEHSYMGDYRMSLICPTGKKAVLKWGTPGNGSSSDTDAQTLKDQGKLPNGSYGGGSRYTGIPYGGGSDGTHDGTTLCPLSNYTNYNRYCDSICNNYGYGLDYCFSRNGDYILNSGKPCDTEEADQDDYIASSAWVDNYVDFPFYTVPAPYVNAGYTASNSTFSTKHPSNHEEKLDYYLPAQDFDELIGCPLNGEWAIQIRDFWGADNGWIFNWSLDICGINQGLGCEYQVDIDSVLWTPDSNYGDFLTGQWRGLNIDNADPMRSVIFSHDTAGVFPIIVRIFDEFGCEWDTTTNETVVWAPEPNLGEDRTICDIEEVVLRASDRHTRYTNQSFKWEPFGQETDTIHTKNLIGQKTLYIVEVENFEYDRRCPTRDSVWIYIHPQPLPNFDPGIYPLEGCEPFTLTFDNTSQNSDNYLWVFGDGDSSTTMNPTHTYGTGHYDFKFYVSSNEGCRDSLVYSDLITVYSSPVARFSWEPMNPTVLHPEVTFQNMTIPQSDKNKYYWEIQYDRDNNISYHTLRDVNPTFEWYTDGEDISGTYIARLIAMTENLGPSGYVVECRDTIENNILLVNDFLQFPSAVTPNGDGVNDRFEIKNLINGLGYPNNSLAIYDRWGKRVYYKENISKEEDFWDPSNVPAGTYFWRFVGKGYLGDIQRNGAVEVLK